jgi:hypothetical protein
MKPTLQLKPILQVTPKNAVKKPILRVSPNQVVNPMNMNPAQMASNPITKALNNAKS